MSAGFERFQQFARDFPGDRNSQPRHCEEQSDEAIHAAACFLRKKSLRLLLATKGGGTTRGRDSGPAALDRFASLAMTALFAAGLGVTGDPPIAARVERGARPADDRREPAQVLLLDVRQPSASSQVMRVQSKSL
ncbi:hypothetical protein [Roseiarcus fermentans]|uniref:hypothetical protein n=1 Tax=Roseiarcus fermentans TaxID=1473586 RepID=UPI0011BFE4E3|nr:hypothetical protein [Roseiarcus fermentans]